MIQVSRSPAQNPTLFKVNKQLYNANLNSPNKVIVNQGGTSSSKTYTILQVLFTIAVSEPNVIITIVGQDIPNLKKGALRDAETIVGDSELLQSFISDYNKSDRIYTFDNGTKIEFTSYDNAQDAKSGKRDYLFINEANGIPYNIYWELQMRTRKRIWLDYNPNCEFWVHEKLIGQPDVQLIISDHRHNAFISDEMHARIESIDDPELWRVYARGMTGKVEGLIFREWDVIDEIPPHAKLVAYGMDFGFTNDPTALVAVYRHENKLILDQLIYETRLTNQQISGRLHSLGIAKNKEIICDSAEPKTIYELGLLGWNVHPAKKTADSIRASIAKLKSFKIFVTARSADLRKELSTYKWKQTKDGLHLNEPVDFNNHAIDATRYAILNTLMVNGNSSHTFM